MAWQEKPNNSYSNTSTAGRYRWNIHRWAVQCLHWTVILQSMLFKSLNFMCSSASTKKSPEHLFVYNYLAIRVNACPFALRSSVARSTKHSHLFTAAEKISRMPYANICSAGWLCSGETGLARCAILLWPWIHRHKGALDQSNAVSFFLETASLV